MLWGRLRETPPLGMYLWDPSERSLTQGISYVWPQQVLRRLSTALFPVSQRYSLPSVSCLSRVSPSLFSEGLWLVVLHTASFTASPALLCPRLFPAGYELPPIGCRETAFSFCSAPHTPGALLLHPGGTST